MGYFQNTILVGRGTQCRPLGWSGGWKALVSMVQNKILLPIVIGLLASCGPSGNLEVSQISHQEFTVRIVGTSDEQGKCLGDISVYILDKNKNYTENNRLYSRSEGEINCNNKLNISLGKSDFCKINSMCELRFISQNGVYKYTKDVIYQR